MSVPSRKAARHALRDAMAPQLTLAAEVLAYKPTKPSGKSPVVGIQTVNSDADKATSQGSKAEFDMSIVILVNLSSAASEDAAEDQLDDVWQQVKNFLETVAANTANWLSLVKNGKSSTNYFVPVAGTIYLQETIPVRLTVM